MSKRLALVGAEDDEATVPSASQEDSELTSLERAGTSGSRSVVSGTASTATRSARKPKKSKSTLFLPCSGSLYGCMHSFLLVLVADSLVVGVGATADPLGPQQHAGTESGAVASGGPLESDSLAGAAAARVADRKEGVALRVRQIRTLMSAVWPSKSASRVPWPVKVQSPTGGTLRRSLRGSHSISCLTCLYGCR